MNWIRTLVLLALVVAAILEVGVLTSHRGISATSSQTAIDNLTREIFSSAMSDSSRSLHAAAHMVAPVPNVASDIYAAPVAVDTAGIVLVLEDIGPGFVLVTTRDQAESGFSSSVRYFGREGKSGYLVQPEGPISISSIAIMGPDPASLDQIFNELVKVFVERGAEVPIPAIGGLARAAQYWGDGPFDPGAKVVLFRAESLVAGVLIGDYEAPDDMEQILSLARLMASRAGR